MLYLSSSTFTPNEHHVDVLTKKHQTLLSCYLRAKVPVWIVLSDIGPLPGLDMQEVAQQEFAGLDSRQTSPHLSYLREYIQRRQPRRTALEKYGAGFQDWPQSPLQPLSDNLDSMTYEVFEKDPVKYAWYECALTSCLDDFGKNQWPGGGPDGKITVAVVGAGRGPLVQRVLQASAVSGVAVECWALEKNPSAFVYLQKRNKTDWMGKVHLVHSDMRTWQGPVDFEGRPQPVNILVSELLGSLADNELSPECLDGVQHLLHPTHGVSIPSNYTAFATPVSAPELWRTIRYRAPNNIDGQHHDPLMLPYVSWIHASDFLSTSSSAGSKQSTDPQTIGRPPIIESLWSFSHPLPSTHIHKSNLHNARESQLTFSIPHRGVCHGIAGYFEATLYDRHDTYRRLSPSKETASSFSRPPPFQPWPHDTSRVLLSTSPLTMSTESPDMISWFPLFFPFKAPLYVPDGGEMNVSLWRKTDGKAVWYEWYAAVEVDGVLYSETAWGSNQNLKLEL